MTYPNTKISEDYRLLAQKCREAARKVSLEKERDELLARPEPFDILSSIVERYLSAPGVFAEFERTMMRQRISAGLKRAVAQGVKLGRPKIDGATERKGAKAACEGCGYVEGG
jgi:DNA invertase Pin-like site-specific DNA recombinase